MKKDVAKEKFERIINNLKMAYTQRYGNFTIKRLYFRRKYLFSIKGEFKWLSLSEFLTEQEAKSIGFKPIEYNGKETLMYELEPNKKTNKANYSIADLD